MLKPTLLTKFQQTALAGMYARGWHVQTEVGDIRSKLHGDSVIVSVSASVTFFKNGKPKSKELWDAELTEVCNEIIAELDTPPLGWYRNKCIPPPR